MHRTRRGAAPTTRKLDKRKPKSLSKSERSPDSVGPSLCKQILTSSASQHRRHTLSHDNHVRRPRRTRVQILPEPAPPEIKHFQASLNHRQVAPRRAACEDVRIQFKILCHVLALGPYLSARLQGARLLHSTRTSRAALHRPRIRAG
jgi:hypothetical protein